MTPTKRRGRPRPAETIDRDRRVLALLRKEGPLTRNEVAEKLELPKMVTWLSLDRLRKNGKVRTCTREGGGMVWSADAKEPCP